MKKKIDSIALIDVIVIMLLLGVSGVSTIFIMVEEVNSYGTQAFENVTKIELIAEMLNLWFFNIILVTFKSFWIVALYIGIRIAYRKYRKGKIEKIDLKNDNYYREILPKYSPAVLSYIDNFKIDRETIIATILGLELKGKIKIENNIIEICEDTENDLEENEKYVLSKIRENNLKNINIDQFIKFVKKDACELGLIKNKMQNPGVPKDMPKSKAIRIMISLVVFLILGIICIFPSLFGKIGETVTAFAFLGGLLFIFVIIPILCIYGFARLVFESKDPYIRTEEGSILNVKLEGLKKYLKDYSKIDEKDKEQLSIWEDFLIYSVIFEINTKIVDEMYNKIFK